MASIALLVGCYGPGERASGCHQLQRHHQGSWIDLQGFGDLGDHAQKEGHGKRGQLQLLKIWEYVLCLSIFGLNLLVTWD